MSKQGTLNKKKRTVTLRFSILSIFLSLFLSTFLLLILLTYFRSKEAMLFTANQLLHEVSESILLQLNTETTDAARELLQTSDLIQQNNIDLKDMPKLTAYLAGLGNRYNLVKSTFWADEDGKMVIAETEQDEHVIIKELDVSKNPYIEKITYYDPRGKLLKKGLYHSRTNLDPRQKAWYQKVKATNQLTWTDVYPLETTSGLGITWAVPVFNKEKKLRGIFGLDISLETLTYFVEQQKVGQNGFAFIISKNGTVIAMPQKLKQHKLGLLSINDLQMPWVKKSFELYSKNKNPRFDFKYQNNIYLARYEPIPYFTTQGWLLGLIVPQNDFIGELKKDMIFDVFLSLIILAISILLVSHIVTLIIQPIKKLVKQTQYIKNFELSHKLKIDSRIKEVIVLTDALQSMRLGLKAFQQYVPASLVRQLIETGENARIGGTKKPLAILFTDIKNFTTVAESMDPNVLMEYMCEYFNELAKIITSESGTIDKYIGDSVMAFWGAPLPVLGPCEHAAKAALKCKKRLEELNIIWKKEGKKPLITRVGIHAGDAIVGNVGSDERLNYTALGDSINEASRLEEANKYYGTQIIVSGAVYEAIKNNFVMRKIDYIAVKGKTFIETIYELLAENKNELSFDVDSLLQHFDKGFEYYQNQHWKEAISEFEVCLHIYHNDNVSLNFIKRCEKYLSHPPKKWDGVWRVNE